MAQSIPNFNHSYFFDSLDTYNYTMINSGATTLTVKLTDTLGNDGINITINQNGSLVSSVTAPSVITNEFNLLVPIAALAGDVISVIVTSSSLPDATPNVLRGSLVLSPVS